MAPKRKTTAPKKATQAKRARKEPKDSEPVDPMVEKANKITEAIEKYFEQPDNIKTMLLQTAGFIFETPMHDRKSKNLYYDPLFCMIGETLSNFVNQHKQKVEESESKVSNSDRIREDNIATKDGLEKAMEMNREKIAEHTTVVKELEMKVNKLDEEHRDRVMEAADVEAAAEKLETEKGRIEASFEAYKKVRDFQTGKDAKEAKKEAKKVTTTLQKYFAKLGGYESLIPSIALILESPAVEERPSFDKMVLAEVDKIFDENLEKLRESIAHERAQAEPQTKARELAEAAAESAKADHVEGEKVMEGLKAEAKEMTSKFKQTIKEIKNHDSDMETLKVRLEEYKEELSQLEGVYEGFITLRDQSDSALDEQEKEEEEKKAAAQNLERIIEEQKATAVAEAQKAKAEAEAAMTREQEEKKLEEQNLREKRAIDEAEEKLRLEQIQAEKTKNEEAEMNHMMHMQQ